MILSRSALLLAALTLAPAAHSQQLPVPTPPPPSAGPQASAVPTDSNANKPPATDGYLLTLGDHFYDSGQYYRAITTYQELALFTTNPALQRYCQLRVAMAYHHGGQYADAISAYDRLTSGFQLDLEFGAIVHLQRSLARSGQAQTAPTLHPTDSLVAELIPLTTNPAADHYVVARFYLARLQLQQGDRPAARELLRTTAAHCADRAHPDCALLAPLDEALATASPRHRSPALGLLLSTAVPGLGSVYSENYVDGAYYFALTVGSALGAYDIYDDARGFGDQKTSFYALGTLAVTFYASNLLQGYFGAHRFNLVEKYRYQRELLDQTRAPLPYDQRPIPGGPWPRAGGQ